MLPFILDLCTVPKQKCIKLVPKGTQLASPKTDLKNTNTKLDWHATKYCTSACYVAQIEN